MDFHAIKITLLAGNIATKCFVLVDLGLRDPIIVTHSNREAVNDIDGCPIEGFPQRSSKSKELDKEVFHMMQSAMIAARAQHVRNTTSLLKKTAGTL